MPEFSQTLKDFSDAYQAATATTSAAPISDAAVAEASSWIPDLSESYLNPMVSLPALGSAVWTAGSDMINSPYFWPAIGTIAVAGFASKMTYDRYVRPHEEAKANNKAEAQVEAKVEVEEKTKPASPKLANREVQELLRENGPALTPMYGRSPDGRSQRLSPNPQHQGGEKVVTFAKESRSPGPSPESSLSESPVASPSASPKPSPRHGH